MSTDKIFKSNMYLSMCSLQDEAYKNYGYTSPTECVNNALLGDGYFQKLCSSGYSAYGYASEQDCKDDITSTNLYSNVLWRVTRVNGDGTIRLTADDPIGYTKFNEIFDENDLDEKNVGYTYDNSSPNVQDGTPSTIKTYLDNWYTTNMSEYDNLIANTRYCNDTSISEIDQNSVIYYGAYGRLYTNKTPQFTCPNTEKTYGGEYDLKIGLLSADENAFAGGCYGIVNPNYYLLTTALSEYTIYSSPFAAFNMFILSGTNGSLAHYLVNFPYMGVTPVINLKSDVLYTMGDGTIVSPFIISS